MRFADTSVVIGVAHNMEFGVCADFFDTNRLSYLFDQEVQQVQPERSHFLLQLSAYSSGRFGIGYWLATSLQGATITATANLDAITETLMASAVTGVWDWLPILPTRMSRCVGSNLWLNQVTIDISRPVRQVMRTRKSGAIDLNFNLCYFVSSNQSQTTTLGTSLECWVEFDHRGNNLGLPRLLAKN
jgi:hypothetical protein